VAYGTPQDFIDAFGEVEAIDLTNLDDVAATAVNPIPLGKALDDASGFMDGYFGHRYLLPLSATSATVNRVSLDIARYFLDRIKSREDVRLRYEDALKWLEGVGKGTISLGTETVGGTNLEAIGRDSSGSRAECALALDWTGW
jgi:phage gp36-like protein